MARKLTYETATTRPERTTVQAVVSQMPLNYLLCRAFAHPWGPPGHWEYDPARVRYYTEVTCSQCAARKYRQIDSRGYNVLSPPYFYPDGFLHGEVNLVTREGLAAVRREIRRRMEAGEMPE